MEKVEATGAAMKHGVLMLLAGTIVKLDGIPCRIALDVPIESEHYRVMAHEAANANSTTSVPHNTREG